MTAILQAWVLSMMLLLQPHAPWRDTYSDTATAIAHAAQDAPIFRGKDGPAKTAALLVSVGWFEGRFDPHATGDHGAAVTTWQVHRENFIVPVSMVLNDTELGARETLRVMAISFHICRNHPEDELLSNYASGGPACETRHDASRHRMQLAKKLLREHPPVTAADPS